MEEEGEGRRGWRDGGGKSNLKHETHGVVLVPPSVNKNSVGSFGDRVIIPPREFVLDSDW
jgi:hypothetical protein